MTGSLKRPGRGRSNSSYAAVPTTDKIVPGSEEKIELKATMGLMQVL